MQRFPSLFYITFIALAKGICNETINTFGSPSLQGFNMNTNNPIPTYGMQVVKPVEPGSVQQLQMVQQEAQKRADIMGQESCDERRKAVNLQKEAENAHRQAQEAQMIFNNKQDQAFKQANLACKIKKEAQEAQQRAINAEMQAQQSQQASQQHLQQAARSQQQYVQDSNLQNETQTLINNIRSTCNDARQIAPMQAAQQPVYTAPQIETQQFVPMAMESFVPGQTVPVSNVVVPQATPVVTEPVLAPISTGSTCSCTNDSVMNTNNYLGSLMGSFNPGSAMTTGCTQGLSSCLFGGNDSSMLISNSSCSQSCGMGSCGSNAGGNSCNSGCSPLSKEDIATKQLTQCMGKSSKELQYFAPKGVTNISDVLQLPSNGPIPIFSSTCDSLQAKQAKSNCGCC